VGLFVGLFERGDDENKVTVEKNGRKLIFRCGMQNQTKVSIFIMNKFLNRFFSVVNFFA